jgi:hypothetical protein
MERIRKNGQDLKTYSRQGVCEKCNIFTITRQKPKWCRNCFISYAFTLNLSYKRTVLRHYSGGGLIHCVCCGEGEFGFLCLDHINGGGAKHRLSINSGGGIYRRLIKLGLPDGYQTLCFNCNASKGGNGKCVHQKS